MLHTAWRCMPWRLCHHANSHSDPTHLHHHELPSSKWSLEISRRCPSRLWAASFNWWYFSSVPALVSSIHFLRGGPGVFLPGIFPSKSSLKNSCWGPFCMCSKRASVLFTSYTPYVLTKPLFLEAITILKYLRSPVVSGNDVRSHHEGGAGSTRQPEV